MSQKQPLEGDSARRWPHSAVFGCGIRERAVEGSRARKVWTSARQTQRSHGRNSLHAVLYMKRALYEERDNRVSQVGALVKRPMHVRRLSLAVELGLGLRVLLSSLLHATMVRGFQRFPITPDSRN
jgi:hypothetical protein